MWGFVFTKKIISSFKRNMPIDIKIIFGYRQLIQTQDSQREKVNDDKEVNSTWAELLKAWLALTIG